MAWTAPKTFTAGSTLLYTEMNTYLKDNLNQTFPALATTDNMYLVTTGLNTVAARQAVSDNDQGNSTTTSTSYTDTLADGLTTAVTTTTGDRAWVLWAASISNNTANTSSRVSFRVSGATTIASTNNYALHNKEAANNRLHACMSVSVPLTAGSNTFTLQYSVQAGTGSFQFREIVVMPF